MRKGRPQDILWFSLFFHIVLLPYLGLLQWRYLPRWGLQNPSVLFPCPTDVELMSGFRELHFPWLHLGHRKVTDNPSVIITEGSGVEWPGFKSQLCHLWTTWLWATLPLCALISLPVKGEEIMGSHSWDSGANKQKVLSRGTLQPPINVNYYSCQKTSTGWGCFAMKNFPKAPRAERWEFSAISLTRIKHQGRGTSQVPTILASIILFTTPAASVMSHSYTCLCTRATLSGYLLVVCDKFYKENTSWQLVLPFFLHSNHILMGWVSTQF